MFKRKIVCVLLTALLVTALLPFGSGFVFAAGADGMQMLGSVEIEAMAANGIADIKSSVDAQARVVIGGLETMATEFEQRRTELQAIVSNGGFLAPIGASDSNAIQISTAQQLSDIRNNLSGFYVLMNDIDLSGFNDG
ncbi:MAG: hypothetical protein LBP73_04190 [Clostridiales Family XIII bacterium]|jgi:hypothetical protein|nr:hypothetical protein [Clostridiales Family XIII bacterium]